MSRLHPGASFTTIEDCLATIRRASERQTTKPTASRDSGAIQLKDGRWVHRNGSVITIDGEHRKCASYTMASYFFRRVTLADIAS